ncbi:hypothetical protein HYG86_06965 [Alkalicella caledoniensis]|uniref:Uncharacterized protein n=1 Tax=Alkalicella caledoniensis TaxID=2731377 RepID=A0A7G9W776_ALKCA|nr:hypothetical protein [Alkalicella caledoniensis]QNO14538.1 hypothetical protein HYG86_06965 [Alkalicella caledoniensis]
MKRFYSLFVVILILAITLGGFVSIAQAQEEGDIPKTFIVVIDRVLPGEMLEHGGPALKEILNNSSWAILSNTTARGKSSENQAMTVGSGSRALAPNGFNFFNKGEILDDIGAEGLYRTFNRRQIDDEAVFNPYVQNMIYHNNQLYHTVELGKLGSLLEANGLNGVVLGNSDDFEIKRHVAAILMDSDGIVNYGVVDDRILTQNPDFPGGFSTDYGQMVEYLNGYLDLGHVFAIDTGDLHRLDEYYRYYQLEQFEDLRIEAIKDTDELFGSILNVMSENDQLYLLTLNAPYFMREEGENIPVIHHYTKDNAGSLLTAPSTKRPGVVTTLDIAPSILATYGIESTELYGSIMGVLADEDHSQTIIGRLNQINTVFNQRPFTIRFFIVITIIFVVAALVNTKLKSLPQYFFSYLVLVSMAGPLAFLIMPVFGPLPLVIYLGLFYVLCVVIMLLLKYTIKDPLNRVIILSSITVTSVLLDTLFNSFLQKQSILGYDVIAGARFYGVGNEYMGVLIGGSIIATLPLMENAKFKKWLYVLYGAIIFIMMAPFFGTNFGGTLALSVTFGVALTDVKKGKGLYKYILALGGIFVLAVAAMLLLNTMTENQTHIGRLFAGDNVNRMEEILMAITRKLSMNWKLVQFSIWSRIFGVLLVSTIILGFYPPKKFDFIKEQKHYRGVKAILAGSLAALFLNDSGIVAAATAMLFLALPILYMFCIDNSDSTSSQLE